MSRKRVPRRRSSEGPASLSPAERELAAAAKLQAEDGAKLHDELRSCQKALDAERERSKALDNNIEAAREAMAVERKLLACSTQEAGEVRKNPEDEQSAKVRAEADLIQIRGGVWNSRVVLVEERDRFEALIQKADASDKYVEEVRARQKELGGSRESLTAEREVAAVARLQADHDVEFRDELRGCQKALVAERERSKALEKYLVAARETMAVEGELSFFCSTQEAGEVRKNQEDAQAVKTRADTDLV